MDLTISRAGLAQIVERANASPTAEICGLLLGTGARVVEVRPCANIAPDPRDSFEIDSAALIAAWRASRDGGAAPIGNYHSHPNGSATPSVRDAAMAQPGSFWIIVAGGKAACWWAGPKGFEPATMRIG